MPVEPTGSGRWHIGTSGVVAVAALVLVLVAGFVVLGLAGRDTSAYTLFLAGPLVTSLIGALLVKKVAVVEDVARTVEAATNGALTAKIESIHDHLTAQTDELLAQSSEGPPAPSGRSVPGPRVREPGADLNPSERPRF